MRTLARTALPAAILLLGVTACLGTAHAQTTIPAAEAGVNPVTKAGAQITAGSRYFVDSDPINLGVTGNAPQQDEDSATLAAMFGSAAYDANFGWGPESAAGIYQASAGTPTYKVTPRQPDWGDPFGSYTMPWDPSWNVTDHVDGWAVVISADGSYAFECWELKVTNGTPSCQFGAISHPDSTSWDIEEGGAPTGAGLSRMAGVITQDDWDNGIDHALVYGTPDNDNQWAYPATRTDGDESGPMHEGQYIWMDRSGACANPSGLNTAQQRVYKALQDYGAFNVDNAETFGFATELHATPPGMSSSGGYESIRNFPWAACLHVGTVTDPDPAR